MSTRNPRLAFPFRFAEEVPVLRDSHARDGHSSAERYQDALRREAAVARRPPSSLGSIYFGGERPLTLSAAVLGRILEDMRGSSRSNGVGGHPGGQSGVLIPRGSGTSRGRGFPTG